MNTTHEITCFKLTKGQAIILIVSCNILHLVACVIGNNGFVSNMLSIFLVVLVSIYLIVLLNVLEKSNDLDINQEEKNIIKSLRNEYRAVLQHKKRKLLFKQACFIDTTLNDNSKPVQKIHLDYLKKIISDDSHSS